MFYHLAKEVSLVLTNILLSLVFLLCAISCFACMIQFKKEKWLFLIAGYNDLTKEQQATLDQTFIAHFSSRLCLVSGLYVLLEWITILFVINREQTHFLFLIAFIVFPTFFFFWYVIKRAIFFQSYYNSLL